MRLALESLQTRGLSLLLSEAADGLPQKVELRSALDVTGALEQAEGRLTLTGAAAREVVFAAIGIVFGSVRLTEGELAARDLFTELTREGSRLALRAGAAALHAESSALDVGAFHVEGQVRLEGLVVTASDATGQVVIDTLEIRGFRLRDGAVSAIADSLTVRELRVGWGAGAQLEAESVESPELRFSAQGVELSAHAVAGRGVSWRNGRATVRDAELGTASITGYLVDSNDDRPHGNGVSRPLDLAALEPYLRVLDGLSGHLNVDVLLDLKIPLLGTNRRTHELRVPIEKGSFDFRRLEGNLATLENALLDFAVRDGALGLELGIPLLPTRGRGKQLVVWPLSSPDLALAQQNRVRLATLPRAQLAAGQPPSAAEESAEREGNSPFALEHLGAENLDLRLTLAHVGSDEAVRRVRVDELTLRGEVHHVVEGSARLGELVGALRALRLELEELPLGVARLTLEGLDVQDVSDLHLHFQDTHPTRVNGVVTALRFHGLELSVPPSSSSSRPRASQASHT